MPVGHCAHNAVADIAVMEQATTLPRTGTDQRVKLRPPLWEMSSRAVAIDCRESQTFEPNAPMPTPVPGGDVGRGVVDQRTAARDDRAIRKSVQSMSFGHACDDGVELVPGGGVVEDGETRGDGLLVPGPRAVHRHVEDRWRAGAQYGVAIVAVGEDQPFQIAGECAVDVGDGRQFQCREVRPVVIRSSQVITGLVVAHRRIGAVEVHAGAEDVDDG